MKVLLDTNVLLDYVWARNDNHENARSAIKACMMEDYDGYVSSHSLCDCFFITRHALTRGERRELLFFFLSIFHVIAESSDDFVATLKQDCFFDLEDGLQIQCAESNHLDYIVTGNLKHFAESEIPAISLNDFISLIK